MPPLQIRSLKKTSKQRKEVSQQQETESKESSSQPTGASEEQSDSLTSSEVETPKQQEAQPTESKTESKEETKQKEAQPTESKTESKEETRQDENQPTESKTESKEETRQDENQPDESKAETTTRFFQAVGVIEGDVSFNKKGKAKVTISGQTYPLLYIATKKYRLWALQKEIEDTGNTFKRLVVYPKAVHVPDRNKPHQIEFQFVRFESETRQGASEELDNMEFQLAGIWQFIPVCDLPCLSIYKNFTPERIQWMKKADAKKRVNFQKPVHLPLLWNDAPVKPFKYNPKAEEQEKPAFVKIKAKFNPSQNAFEFLSLLEEPTTEEVPRFLKPSKEDKKLVEQNKKKKKGKNSPPQKTSQKNKKEQTTEERELSLEERINQIANQLENLSEIAQQNQGKQAELITNQLIAHGLKDDNYTLPKNYISNWKHGRNVPKETSKHYSAYRLWQCITSHS